MDTKKSDRQWWPFQFRYALKEALGEDKYAEFVFKVRLGTCIAIACPLVFFFVIR